MPCTRTRLHIPAVMILGMLLGMFLFPDFAGSAVKGSSRQTSWTWVILGSVINIAYDGILKYLEPKFLCPERQTAPLQITVQL